MNIKATVDSNVYSGINKILAAGKEVNLQAIANLQNKTVTTNGDVTPDANYDGLSKVTVNVPNPSTGEKQITTTASVDVTNYATAKVVDSNLVASNIKAGVSILGIAGSHEGGSDTLSLNLLPTEITNARCESVFYPKKLISVTFSSTPTSIPSTAFSECTNLTDIYVPWVSGAVSGEPWGAPSTTDIHYNCEVKSIASKSDWDSALSAAGYDSTQIWNITNDFTITETLSTNKRFKLVLNGNGHTITASNPSATTPISHALKFEAGGGVRNTNVTINNLKIVVGSNFRHGIYFKYKLKDGSYYWVESVLNNVEVDSTNAYGYYTSAEDNKLNCCIVNNDCEITFRNNLKLTTGQYAFSGLNCDSTTRSAAAMSFISPVSATYIDGRSATIKASKPFMTIDGTGNTITGASLVNLEAVTGGYDIISE